MVIEDGSFRWEPEVETLKNINLTVKDGEMVAVVGSVGSGKSSLLSALLNELIKTSGRVNIRVRNLHFILFFKFHCLSL